MLRLTDTKESKRIWPHSFELLYKARSIVHPRCALRGCTAACCWEPCSCSAHWQVSLGERELSCALNVRNMGEARFTFTGSLQTHIGVDDATSDKVLLLVRRAGVEPTHFWNQLGCCGACRDACGTLQGASANNSPSTLV